MNFRPKTEKELESERLLPQATYPFEVMQADEQTSKKGNAMIALKLTIYGQEMSIPVYDYISDSFMAHRLRHFCYSVGLTAAYESGKLTAIQCVGRQGYAAITIEDDGKFPAKNVVRDYIVDEVPDKTSVPILSPAENAYIDSQADAKKEAEEDEPDF